MSKLNWVVSYALIDEIGSESANSVLKPELDNKSLTVIICWAWICFWENLSQLEIQNNSRKVVETWAGEKLGDYIRKLRFVNQQIERRIGGVPDGGGGRGSAFGFGFGIGRIMVYNESYLWMDGGCPFLDEQIKQVVDELKLIILCNMFSSHLCVFDQPTCSYRNWVFGISLMIMLKVSENR